MASNTGAPRIAVEISAITTDLKKGLADARAEIQKFNKEVGKSEYKNVLDAERLATQKARTEAVNFASTLKSSLAESLNNARVYTENARKSTEDYRQTLLSNKSALEQSRVATEQQRQATEAERTALANSRSELARIALEKRKAQQVTVALAGSYREAQQRLTALGNTIKNAEGGFNSKSRAIRAQINEYNTLNTKLKDFDRNMGNNQRNVGNYPQLLSSIPVVGQLTSAVGALAVAQQGLSKSFSTNLRFDALTTALKNISGDSETFAENMQFLETLTNRLGLSFLSTADAFKMWQGSAKFSNLTAEESRRIFESVANASAKMKLSQDQTSGAFLALSQMMSKGKVQAEELRGQLGERLPGAFNLAAKAMGVTEAELNKMLETGQVVANDFLPKFATQLDKSFGNDKTEKIESMQASLNRLNNEFDKLFLSDNGKSFFQNTMDGFSNILSEINDVSNGVSRASGWFDILNNARKRGDKPSITGLPLKGSDFSFTNIAKGAKDTSTAYNLVTKAVQGNSAEVTKNKTYWEGQVASLKAVRDALSSADVGTKKWIETTNALKKAQAQVDLFSDKKPKGGSQATKDLEEVKRLTEEITKSNLSAYEQKLFDIDKKYANIIAKISDPKLLGLAEQNKQAEVLRASIEQLNESLKVTKTLGSGMTTTTGTISIPTAESMAGRRLGTRIKAPKIELDEFTSQFQSTLRRGLSSTFNDFFSGLNNLSNASYEVEKKYADLRKDASASQIVALNEMERIERSINNGLTNTLSKIGSTFSQIGGNLLSSALSTGIASGDFKDIKGLFSGDKKAMGYGALGSLLGGALGGALKPTDTVGQGLSGALSGAGTGAAIGSLIAPGVGTIVGAIGGALIGGLSSILGSSKAKKQEELAQKQYEEQKKQTLLMERQTQLAYTSQIIAQMTNQGVVTSIERDALGNLTAKISGKDIILAIERTHSGR